MICSRTCRWWWQPASTVGRRRRGASGDTSRALTHRAGFRYAALFLIALALGSEIDLREIASAKQDTAWDQAEFAAAVVHCGPRDQASRRPRDGPVVPDRHVATLEAALSLPAPLVTEPPMMAAPGAFQAAVLIGHSAGMAPSPPKQHAHRSRAPPSRV